MRQETPFHPPISCLYTHLQDLIITKSNSSYIPTWSYLADPGVSFPLPHFFPIGLLDAKDLMIITGRKPRRRRKLLAKIRKRYRKEKDHFVTVREFSLFTGIDEESIFATISYAWMTLTAPSL